MSASSSHASILSGAYVFAGLTPVVLAVFLGFLAVSVPLGALSLELGDNLGFGAIVVGSVIGLQSLATLLTRHQAGPLCDRRGPRRAVLIGLPLAASSGVAYYCRVCCLSM
jgi:nitrate/nitrite transporter NarK